MTYLRSSNKSGYRNISWYSRLNMWVVELYVDGKKKRIGKYKELDDAVKARDKYIHDNNIYIKPYSGLSTIELKRKWQNENRDKVDQCNKKSRQKLKEEVINQYGGKCKCCEESNIVFLTIHHSLNNGAQHRKDINRKSGHHFYTWLKINQFPKDIGLEVMCYNCNCAIQINNGVCPHQNTDEQVAEVQEN